MANSTTMGRRRALGLLAAAAPALAALPATAMTAEPDPIFAAIDRHKEAFQIFVDACARTDEVAAEEEGRVVTDADLAADDATAEIEREALSALVAVAPTTWSGIRAAIEYLVWLDIGCIPETSGRFLPTLLKSPLLAG